MARTLAFLARARVISHSGALLLASIPSGWHAFSNGEWVRCQGSTGPNRAHSDWPSRPCGRPLVKLPPGDDVLARYAGQKDERGNAPKVQGHLHYCRDCRSYTEVRHLHPPHPAPAA